MTGQGSLLDVVVDAEQLGRRAHDYYPTPAWMTVALLKRIPVSGRVLEPCAGRGAISEVLRACPRLIVSENEPFESCPTATWRLDAAQPATWQKWSRFDWVVTNPPFALADQIVPQAVAAARIGVAMLLRLSWLEPTQARAAFLERHVPSLIVLPRHSFRGNAASDSVTSAWCIWLANDGHQRYGTFRNDVVTRAERDQILAAAMTARDHQD